VVRPLFSTNARGSHLIFQLLPVRHSYRRYLAVTLAQPTSLKESFTYYVHLQAVLLAVLLAHLVLSLLLRILKNGTKSPSESLLFPHGWPLLTFLPSLLPLLRGSSMYE
jgi:hypothetical protein